MNFLSTISSSINLDTIVLAMSIFYIVMPIDMPDFISNFVDTSVGMFSLFGVAIYLFFNKHVSKYAAIIFIIAAYELIRRSSNINGKVSMVKYTPTQAKKDEKMKQMNPIASVSLEEEVVEQMAPIGKSDISVYTSSTFKPVANNVGSASMF